MSALAASSPALVIDSTSPSHKPLVAAWANTNIRRVIAVIVGSMVLASSAFAEVPMYPVPITLQTLAVLLIGALYGQRLAAVTVLAYLAEGAIGLPVFAGGKTGLLYMAGTTGGYLIGFLLTATLIGVAADRGWLRNLFANIATMLVGHLVILTLGVTWLAAYMGMNMDAAITTGFVPFLYGTAVKSAAATATLLAIATLRKKS